jgi:hypothetical protein
MRTEAARKPAASSRTAATMVMPGALMDIDLVDLEAALRVAGHQAALTLRGRTQPTRWFSIELRSGLVGRTVPGGSEPN